MAKNNATTLSANDKFKTTIKVGSITNTLLNYARMKQSSYFTLEGFRKLRLDADKPSIILRALNALIGAKFVVEIGPGRYRITRDGIDKLMMLGQKRREIEVAALSSNSKRANNLNGNRPQDLLQEDI